MDLKESGVIPADVSDSWYKRRLQQQQRYVDLMDSIREQKVKHHQQVIDLKEKGCIMNLFIWSVKTRICINHQLLE